MRSRKYSKLIMEAAKNAGVSTEEFYQGIEEAIQESIKSIEPSAKEFWSFYPKGYTPTPDEVILRVTNIVESKLYGN